MTTALLTGAAGKVGKHATFTPFRGFEFTGTAISEVDGVTYTLPTSP